MESGRGETGSRFAWDASKAADRKNRLEVIGER